MFKKTLIIFAAAAALGSCCEERCRIDRHSLVSRNNPVITSPDTLSSLTVGNGGFAFTVDITGLQTFPEEYADGVPLGTQTDWGWHSFPNEAGYTASDALKSYHLWHPDSVTDNRAEIYSTQFTEGGRAHDASEYLRANPHRLHLGCIGLELDDTTSLKDIHDARQELNMWDGEITSQFTCGDTEYRIATVAHPERDAMSAHIFATQPAGVNIRLPYPTGGHSDNGCDWAANSRHHSTIVQRWGHGAIIRHELDSTSYYIHVHWDGVAATITEKQDNYFVIWTTGGELRLTCEFLQSAPTEMVPSFYETETASEDSWHKFWNEGAAIDFSHCTDQRAAELERRVVLSQYLLAVQCAGATPPQETGLTYNSWFGKFHLEMIWWHQSWLALWGHAAKLDSTMQWYNYAAPMARVIAKRQGYEGLRWMKMTDPSGAEAPSSIGSFLIWQQPHYIYLAELLRRADPANEETIMAKHYDLVMETAEFMASYVTKDTASGCYTLRGCIPAQETLSAEETINPPFELAYWHYALNVAQEWRTRHGDKRVKEWDDITDHLSHLATSAEGLYLAAETAPQTYSERRFTSDHMAVLGALGFVPQTPLTNNDVMTRTADWVWENWNWDQTWGWDYPLTAMNAARLGLASRAVDALLMQKRTNTYLANGHNYQDERLRCYLPGNGGLLTAIAMMCAGWDGCDRKNPGFPADGTWDVRWEGLKPMP